MTPPAAVPGAPPHRVPSPLLAAAPKPPPKLFECKLCGKVFDSEEEHPSCPECDSNDVERVG